MKLRKRKKTTGRKAVITRNEIEQATDEYLRKGGKVTVIDYIPDQVNHDTPVPTSEIDDYLTDSPGMGTVAISFQ